jgi:hypothetical protein
MNNSIVATLLKRAVIFQQYFIRRSKMKPIKTSIPAKLAALLFGAALFGLASQSALALTQSGTSISNTATMNYTVGGIAQTAIAGSVAFTVDDKVNLTVSNGTAANVTPGATNVNSTKFTITNNGNATQGYNLTAANTASATVGAGVTDNFDPGAFSIYLNTGCDGVTVGAVVAGGVINSVAAGASVCVFVQTASISSAQVNNDAAVITLKAVTTWPNPLVAAEEPAAVVANAVVANNSGSANTAGVDVVFADIAGVAAGDVATDGAHSAYGAYKVVTAALTVTKTATLICDQVNGLAASNAKMIPGSIVQYSITIANGAGAAAATLTSISDTLSVASLAMDPGAAAGLNIPAGAGTCVAGAGPYGFKVTVPVARILGGSAAGSNTVSYFTTTTTADGLDFASPTITATFATILPIDAGTGHATAGLLNASESVTIVYNVIVQ